MCQSIRGFSSPFIVLLSLVGAVAAEPLHERIDALIVQKAGNKPVSETATDAEFLRRAYLDFAGRIPTVAEARIFTADKSPDKRTKLIDQLLGGSDYPRRMQELFHVMLMERWGDHPEWSSYLRKSFEANKPWDQLTREILRAAPRDESVKGAAFFLAKRLENYGQNPVDYPALTRDIGRLFLGRDLRCAQCHDHLFVDEYKQQDFQGLFAFVQNAYLSDAKFPTVGEKPTTKKVDFMSVFKKENKATGPRMLTRSEIDVPSFDKGKEFEKTPDTKNQDPGKLKFSLLEKLAEETANAENAAFTRNIVNRLWFVTMGRGLVHPLDLHHKDNPPSHPELLDLLAKEFVEHRFDIKWMLRELALSMTYQRSSVLPGGDTKSAPADFLTALEKRLSAEQLLTSFLEATGEKEPFQTESKTDQGSGSKATLTMDQLRAKFLKTHANPASEPEDEIAPALKSALFVLNDDAVLGRLAPRPGNLLERLSKLPEDDKVAEELYLSVLARFPDQGEKEMVAKHLKKYNERRVTALTQLVWALLASTEFNVNH